MIGYPSYRYEFNTTYNTLFRIQYTLHSSAQLYNMRYVINIPVQTMLTTHPHYKLCGFNTWKIVSMNFTKLRNNQGLQLSTCVMLHIWANILIQMKPLDHSEGRQLEFGGSSLKAVWHYLCTFLYVYLPDYLFCDWWLVKFCCI